MSLPESRPRGGAQGVWSDDAPCGADRPWLLLDAETLEVLAESPATLGWSSEPTADAPAGPLR